VNQHTKDLGQRSFNSKAIVQTYGHTRPIVALPGPQKSDHSINLTIYISTMKVTRIYFEMITENVYTEVQKPSIFWTTEQLK